METQHKVGGKLHLRLNISEKPIVNKYREGKLKSTLKRECKERESDQVKSYRRGEYIQIYLCIITHCVNNIQSVCCPYGNIHGVCYLYSCVIHKPLSYMTRLETRTKKFVVLPSHWVENLKALINVKLVNVGGLCLHNLHHRDKLNLFILYPEVMQQDPKDGDLYMSRIKS